MLDGLGTETGRAALGRAGHAGSAATVFSDWVGGSLPIEEPPLVRGAETRKPHAQPVNQRWDEVQGGQRPGGICALKERLSEGLVFQEG